MNYPKDFKPQEINISLGIFLVMDFLEEYVKPNARFVLILVLLPIILGIITVGLAFLNPEATVLVQMAMLVVLVLLTWIVLAFVGYFNTKHRKGTIAQGAISAAVVAVISGLVSRILSFAVFYPLLVGVTASYSAEAAGAFFVLAPLVAFFAIVFGLITDAFAGMVFGAIGAFFAPHKRENFSSENKLFGGEKK